MDVGKHYISRGNNRQKRVPFTVAVIHMYRATGQDIAQEIERN